MSDKKYLRKGKRKEIVFREDDWEIIKEKAATLNIDTTKYIVRAAVHGDTKNIDFKELAALSRELNAIGNNINQLAKKANEINSIYVEDYRQMKEVYERLCRMLNHAISEQLHCAA